MRLTLVGKPEGMKLDENPDVHCKDNMYKMVPKGISW
jgi:hypothetical protein